MPSDKPLLSLVINYYNPSARTKQEAAATMCLESIADCTRNPFEVILSDGSGIDSPAIRAVCERLGFIYLLCPIPKVLGAIYNQGLAGTRGRYRVMLEYDIFLAEDWDLLMLTELERTKANIVLPYISSCDNHIQQSGFVVRHTTFEPSGLSQNFVLMDEKAFATLYPLDEQFNGTCIDNDMYMKARAAALRIIVCFAGNMVHYRRISAAYNPWTFDEDHQRFKLKYPYLMYWDRYGLYNSFTPQFCRSATYRLLGTLAASVPSRALSTYILKHLTRAEPIFHRI